ncbi:hypothetical protein AUEXF2481DRAFT_627855 [Aureobasidium subglaciale EXF-2481]|uniref:Uncharacterized protein n=1 Tax=Aureobasidium subglaciale (strain EXF-2481) TaxID=1043005 RepID=A0A074YGV6_AURSE|nr:uncharacterized protein AUEXF2481DRAFT_627855 [Aureobasidium subglaciale EXF-2481]KEQ97043.1 hypothetical protein AUEXF2481DRAFT_627855 [Aureobasidium subglaciale EXF-2481]
MFIISRQTAFHSFPYSVLWSHLFHHDFHDHHEPQSPFHAVFPAWRSGFFSTQKRRYPCSVFSTITFVSLHTIHRRYIKRKAQKFFHAAFPARRSGLISQQARRCPCSVSFSYIRFTSTQPPALHQDRTTETSNRRNVLYVFFFYLIREKRRRGFGKEHLYIPACLVCCAPEKKFPVNSTIIPCPNCSKKIKWFLVQRKWKRERMFPPMAFFGGKLRVAWHNSDY